MPSRVDLYDFYLDCGDEKFCKDPGREVAKASMR